MTWKKKIYLWDLVSHCGLRCCFRGLRCALCSVGGLDGGRGGGPTSFPSCSSSSYPLALSNIWEDIVGQWQSINCIGLYAESEELEEVPNILWGGAWNQFGCDRNMLCDIGGSNFVLIWRWTNHGVYVTHVSKHWRWLKIKIGNIWRLKLLCTRRRSNMLIVQLGLTFLRLGECVTLWQTTWLVNCD